MGPLLSAVHSLSPLILLSFYYHFTSGAAEAQGPDVAEQALPRRVMREVQPSPGMHEGGGRVEGTGNSFYPFIFPCSPWKIGGRKRKPVGLPTRSLPGPLPGWGWGGVVAREHRTREMCKRDANYRLNVENSKAVGAVDYPWGQHLLR